MAEPGILNLGALKEIQGRIKSAAERSGRSLEDVCIVAVTKAFPVSAMLTAFEGGLKVLGESRIQETELKIPEYKYRSETRLHLIGHLQKNKVRKAVKIYDLIESVDTFALAAKIDKAAADIGKTQDIFIQVNTGNDPAKFGMNKDSSVEEAQKIAQLPNINILGLMVIAPYTSDQEIIRQTFAGTREIRDSLLKSGLETCLNLSMGMSSDFEVAVEEGATHVRIGTALFGKRT